MTTPPTTPLAATGATISLSMVAVLGMGTMIGEMSLLVVPLIVSDLVESFGLTEGQVGFVIAARLALFAVTSFVLSSQIHLLDRRLVAFIGTAVIVCANLASAIVDEATFFVATRLLLGVGEAVVLTAVTAIAAGTNNPEKTFSIIAAWFIVLAVVFFLAFPIVLASVGLKLSFLFIAAIVAVLSVPFFILSSEKLMDRVQTAAPFPWAIATIGILVGALLLNVGANTTWFYLERIGARMEIGHQEVGNILALGAVLAIIGPLLGYQINTRFGRTIPITLGFLLLGAMAVLMVYTRSTVVFTVAISAASATFGFCLIYLLGLASVLDGTGRLAASCRGFVAIGNSLAPAVGGGILMTGGIYEHMSWAALIASLLAIGVVYPAARTMDRRRKSPSPQYEQV